MTTTVLFLIATLSVSPTLAGVEGDAMGVIYNPYFHHSDTSKEVYAVPDSSVERITHASPQELHRAWPNVPERLQLIGDWLSAHNFSSQAATVYLRAWQELEPGNREQKIVQEKLAQSLHNIDDLADEKLVRAGNNHIQLKISRDDYGVEYLGSLDQISSIQQIYRVPENIGTLLSGKRRSVLEKWCPNPAARLRLLMDYLIEHKCSSDCAPLIRTWCKLQPGNISIKDKVKYYLHQADPEIADKDLEKEARSLLSIDHSPSTRKAIKRRNP